jgi:hypothetical protein
MLWRDILSTYSDFEGCFVPRIGKYYLDHIKLIRTCEFCADATQHLRKTGRDLSFQIHCPSGSDEREIIVRRYYGDSNKFPGLSVVILDTESDLSGQEDRSRPRLSDLLRWDGEGAVHRGFKQVSRSICCLPGRRERSV